MSNKYTDAFRKFKFNGPNISITLFDGDTAVEFERKISKAQYLLDEIIKHDTEPYVPFRTGTLANTANLTESGIGKVIYYGPQARYLYEGMLMVSPTTGSSYAALGEKKMLTKKKLEYAKIAYDKTAHPLAGAMWFDGSAEVNMKRWIEAAKEGFRNG